ncbi:MAG: hypothetical protein K2O85_01820, partial [Helicobacter sp.]|nr:hypothetical protein [Helicobacter sp.]
MQFLGVAARMYYDFLEQTGRSLESIPIFQKEIRGTIIRLQVPRTIFTESLLLQVGQGFYALDSDDFAVQYDDKNGILTIETHAELVKSGQKETIQLFSDLKFLVQAVIRFYASNRVQPLFHHKRLQQIAAMLPHAIPYAQHLDSYQNHALQLLFANPISYIWGPPGSGKTKGVLLESLLFLLAQKQRTLLLAPTNNALEQILNGILPQVQLRQYPLECVFRLGIASSDFLARYPQCCDYHAQKEQPNLFANKKSSKQRMSEASILAMTLDGFIKRYETIDNIAHIFLDEAPYTPLIKALTLGYFTAPLTMLGDHKQLGPVCEAGEREFVGDGAMMRLWAISSIYAEEFEEDSCTLLAKVANIEPPKLQKTACAQLLQNYRYGQNLTDLLDSCVYHIGLRGQETPTEIFYIDSGKSAPIVSKQYQSMSEVAAIAGLVPYLVQQETQLLRKDCFAILTPFR